VKSQDDGRPPSTNFILVERSTRMRAHGSFPDQHGAALLEPPGTVKTLPSGERVEVYSTGLVPVLGREPRAPFCLFQSWAATSRAFGELRLQLLLHRGLSGVKLNDWRYHSWHCEYHAALCSPKRIFPMPASTACRVLRQRTVHFPGRIPPEPRNEFTTIARER